MSRTRAPSFFTADTPRSGTKTPGLSYEPATPRRSPTSPAHPPSPARPPSPAGGGGGGDRGPSPTPPSSQSKRKVLRRRQSTMMRELTRPALRPVPEEVEEAHYSREHHSAASSRPFKLLEEGFLMDTLIKWVRRSAGEYKSTPTDGEETKADEISMGGEEDENDGEAAVPRADNVVYAKFLLECLLGLRFSQQRSLASLQQTVRVLEIFMLDHAADFTWTNRCKESVHVVGQTLCQAELVSVCLTALIELEMLFNTTIRLADKITELRRYWKDLDAHPWRFNAICFAESWSSTLFDKNSDRYGRQYTCSERVEKLNEILDGHMILLGRAKRLMREVYDIAHEDVEIYEKYKSLMNWAHQAFLLVETRVHDANTAKVQTLCGILDQMKDDYTETSATLSPFLGPALVTHLKSTLNRMPLFYDERGKNIEHLNRPSNFQRRWPEYALISVAIVGGFIWAKKNDLTREDVESSLLRFSQSCTEFVQEHVTDPAQEIYKEIFLNEYMEVTDPEEVEDSKNSLRRNLRDYLVQRELKRLNKGYDVTQFFSKRNESELSASTLAKIQEISQGMKMSDVMRDYETELSEPKSNLLMGNIVHLMLIQMQFMKKEIMVSMAKMDEVLKANHLLVNTMSTVPAFVVSYCGYSFSTFLWRRLTMGDKERRDASLELRITLRDIDQCLNLVAHRSEIDVNGSEVYRMDLRDLGNLAMLLHRFNVQLNVYFKFGHVQPEVQYRMEEDMEELMMEDFSLQQRIRVVERLYRSYDVFHMHGGGRNRFF